MNVRTGRLLTNGLAAACGVLLLAAIAQYAGLGRGYGWLPQDSVASDQAKAVNIDRDPFKLPPMTAFADIDARPLFNADRKPSPADESADDGGEAPANPLDITLTGVVLTPGLKMAMVLEKSGKRGNQGQALKVGMPLEGDLAGWTLVEVKPRSAVFRNGSNETSEVELETATTAAPAPRAPARVPVASRNRQVVPPRPEAGGAKHEPEADLAKRIEERRREMRERAERLRHNAGAPEPRAGAGPEHQPDSPEYRQP